MHSLRVASPVNVIAFQKNLSSQESSFFQTIQTKQFAYNEAITASGLIRISTAGNVVSRVSRDCSSRPVTRATAAVLLRDATGCCCCFCSLLTSRGALWVVLPMKITSIKAAFRVRSSAGCIHQDAGEVQSAAASLQPCRSEDFVSYGHWAEAVACNWIPSRRYFRLIPRSDESERFRTFRTYTAQSESRLRVIESGAI